MDEADDVADGRAVAFDGAVGVEAGEVDAGAAHLEAGVAGREEVVVGQGQVAVRGVADEGEVLADDEALALVASGLEDQPIHAGASVGEGGAGRQGGKAWGGNGTGGGDFWGAARNPVARRGRRR